MKRLLSTRYSDTAFNLGIFILRIVAGGLMIQNGYHKLLKFGEFAANFVDPFGIGNTATLVLVIFAEFFCAVLIVLGLLTRLAAIPLVINMFMAIAIGHNYKIFTEAQLPTLFLAAFITLLFVGPGKYSVDRMIGK